MSETTNPAPSEPFDSNPEAEPRPHGVPVEPAALERHLAEIDPAELQRLLERTEEARAANSGRLARDVLNEWFPLRGQPHGVREVHEHVQLAAFQVLKDGANTPEAGLAMRSFREAAFWAREALLKRSQK